MDETKSKWASLGIWASLCIPIVALILPIVGKADLAALVTEESTGLVEWFTVLGTLIVSAVSYYARMRATKKLT